MIQYAANAARKALNSKITLFNLFFRTVQEEISTQKIGMSI